MAKRSAHSQISREGGGVDNSDEEEDDATKEMPKAKEEVLGARKIRALPARKSATSTPSNGEPAPASKPAFGGAFTFGGGAASTSTGFGSAPPSSSSTPFSFNSTPAAPNPFAAVPSSIFSSPKPSPAVPIFGAAPSTPKPAAASPFSFSGGSPSSFSFGAATSAPPSPAVVPPAPLAATPWGSTPSLPDAETPSSSSALKSLSGPPPKKNVSSSGSMIVEAPSTPQIQPTTLSSSDSPFSKSFGGAANGSPFKPSPLSSSSITSKPAPLFPPSSSSSTTNSTFKAPAATASAPPPKDNKELVDYYKNLRGLNLSLLSLQESLVEKDPFVDLSKTLDDLVKGYRSKREELEKQKKALGIVDDHEVVSEPEQKKEEVVVEKPKAPPVFASGGSGFSFGGAKLDAPAASSTGSSPFSTFPSTSSGSAPAGGFSFGGASTASTASPKPSTGGFSFGAPAPANGGTSTTPSFGSPASLFGSSSSTKDSNTPKKPSTAGSFITSVLSESTPKPADSPAPSTSKAAPFSFNSPSSTTSIPPASPAPFSFTSFGSTPAVAAAAPPPLKTTPSFQRLPGGTPNFSFGAASGSAPKRSVSSSFGFGAASEDVSATTPAPAVEASTSTGRAEGDSEEAPAPTIPSDPTLMEQGVGEEGEETAFEARGAISRFVGKGWDKVGTGLVKIKFGGESGVKGRVLARVEGSGVLLLNVKIHPDIKATIQGGKAVSISVVEKGKPSMISIRVKDAASAERLASVLNERASA
ncbi:hypothetical protein BDY24DRAFT_120611 [Mrakia frigida]|uniref:uncharacterized protein n=1 Tax=Mrakia frigida TaxID=29902 RepID=UPI003FCC1ED2